jgi:hypothetical protein
MLSTPSHSYWLGLFFITAFWLRRPDVCEVISNYASALHAETFDDYLPIFVELLCVAHTKVCFFAEVAPRIFSEHLLLSR